MDLLGLTDAVDAPHALLQAVGVPGDVVVHHQVAELEVDALPGCLGGDHDLRVLAKGALLLDALGELHAAVDHGDVEVLGEVLNEVVERVAVLGEDQQLLAAIVLEALRVDDLEQLGELVLPAQILDLLRQHQQRPEGLELGRELGLGVG